MRKKNTILNDGGYTSNIPTDPLHTVITTDIKTNMRHMVSGQIPLGHYPPDKYPRTNTPGQIPPDKYSPVIFIYPPLKKSD